MAIRRPRCLTIRPDVQGWTWILEERTEDGASGPSNRTYVTGFSPTFERAEQVGWEMYLIWDEQQRQEERQKVRENWPDTSARALLSGD